MSERKKSFFSEYAETKDFHLRARYIWIAFLFGIILLWVYVAIPEQSQNASIYIFMLIAIAMNQAIDDVYDLIGRVKVGMALGLGKKPVQAFIYGIIAIAVINYIQPQILIQPLSIVEASTISFLFIVFAAPYVEAMFFRGTLQPILVDIFDRNILRNSLMAGIVATVTQSLAFAWFHINIFGTAGNFMPYFIFGVIATLGVYFFRSIAFEFGLHGVNNYLAWMVMIK